MRVTCITIFVSVVAGVDVVHLVPPSVIVLRGSTLINLFSTQTCTRLGLDAGARRTVVGYPRLHLSHALSNRYPSLMPRSDSRDVTP